MVKRATNEYHSGIRSKSPERLSKRRKVAAAVLGVALFGGILGGVAHEKKANDYNEELDHTTASILETYADSDAQPGLSVIDGKTVTAESLESRMDAARQSLAQLFNTSESEAIQVGENESASHAMSVKFADGSYHSDTINPFEENKTLDESELKILTLMYNYPDSVDADTARELFRKVDAVHYADTAQSVFEAEEKLRKFVDNLADKTVDEGSILRLPK